MHRTTITYYTIYKITNLVNGKTYIGKHQTTDLDDGYMGSGKLLKLAITKYGIENFRKDILHVFDNEADMNAKEKELVVVSESTYNLNVGGHGGFGYINSNIELRVAKNKKAREVANRRGALERAQLRLSALKNDPVYVAYRTRRWQEAIARNDPTHDKFRTWVGRQHSAESKKRIGEANAKLTGERNSQYGTCWVRNEHGNRKIKKTELDQYLHLGYVQGRKIKQ